MYNEASGNQTCGIFMGKRPLPPLSELQAFCAIVETGGFGRAAERVGQTQTAVSHQLAQLEGWIGGRLFDRGRHGARLTPLGARLHPAIVETLSELETALHEARASVSVRSVSISVSPEFSGQWLASRLPDFCKRHPDIELKIAVGYQRPEFHSAGLDMAIWLGRAEVGLIHEELLTDEEFVVSSPALSRQLPQRYAIRAAPCCAMPACNIRYWIGNAGMSRSLAKEARWIRPSISCRQWRAASYLQLSPTCLRRAAMAKALRWFAARWSQVISPRAGWCAVLSRPNRPP